MKFEDKLYRITLTSKGSEEGNVFSGGVGQFEEFIGAKLPKNGAASFIKHLTATRGLSIKYYTSAGFEIADESTDLVRFLELQVMAQYRSCAIWIKQFMQYRNTTTARNAIFAIGKVHGMFNILHTICGSRDVNAAPEVLEMLVEIGKVYDEAFYVIDGKVHDGMHSSAC